MATSLKTICFPFPPLASITDATVTNFTQITVNLPESSLSFKKVWVEFQSNDIITVTGGTVTERRIGLQLGSAGYNTVTQLNDITHNSENMAAHYAAEFTSYFTTNWSGASMTCDVQVYVDQNTGTTLGQVAGSALLWVTYEYDDTSSTQVANVWIPFTSATGALPTSKGSAYDTVPDIDSMIGGGTISYKQCVVIAEGNEANASGTTDFTLTCQIDTTTAQVGQSHEAALASDRNVREIYDMMSGGSVIFTTNATHSIYWWVSTGAVGRMNHACLTMLVVYTFDATSSADKNISLLAPSRFNNPSGGGATEYNRTNLDLWIEEPTTITIQKTACRLVWGQTSSITGLNVRGGSQSFVAYTNTAAAVCGGLSLQRTVDDNITLSRGKNSLTFDIYRTDTADMAWGLGALWIINYKCGKPSGGWGRANRTVVWPLRFYGTGAGVAQEYPSATSMTIPESAYFVSNFGVFVDVQTGASINLKQFIVNVERLSGEGGIKWERFVDGGLDNDAFPGHSWFYDSANDIFKRYPNDQGVGRIDVETSRRWRWSAPTSITCYFQYGFIVVYHSISWTVTRAITGSGGGTVNVTIFRASDGEALYTTSRVGNGDYTFTSYDTVNSVYAVAYEDGTHRHRSNNFTAS